MPRYRLAKPEEVGAEMAAMLATFNAELLNKGIDKELAMRLVERVAGAASSNSDGHCGDLARFERLIYPPYSE